MDKAFEDFFSELQADMVSICLEYVDGKAGKIYIYSSCEQDKITSDFFFRIDGKLLRKHKLNEGGQRHDVSPARQKAALKILIDDTKKILFLCEEYRRPMPTEIKLIYDVTKKHLDASYSYDLVHSNDPRRTARMVVDDWYSEIELQGR